MTFSSKPTPDLNRVYTEAFINAKLGNFNKGIFTKSTSSTGVHRFKNIDSYSRFYKSLEED
jgi:hypothetical protein